MEDHLQSVQIEIGNLGITAEEDVHAGLGVGAVTVVRVWREENMASRSG